MLEGGAIVELDFSKLENIAYRGFNGAEAEKDTLIEQGFSVIEGAITPFDEPPAPNIRQPEKSRKCQLRPFTGTDQRRNYRAMYRAACDFHERHNPPRVEAAYWASHTPGTDAPPPSEVEYWQQTAQDASDTATAQGNDPFLIGVLAAVYEELEREYEQMRENALDR